MLTGKKLDWVVKELPPLKEVTVGGRSYSDDTDRMNFIRDLTSQVREWGKSLTSGSIKKHNIVNVFQKIQSYQIISEI